MALLSAVSRSNWNLEMLVFVKGGKPEYPEKNPRSRDKNQTNSFFFTTLFFSIPVEPFLKGSFHGLNKSKILEITLILLV